MSNAARHHALALFSLASLAAFGTEPEETGTPSPSLNHRLLPSLIAEYVPDSGEPFPARFGLPILNGVAALRPELDDLEEPPPDPQWPGPMAKNAIYFGGTDYGRFIPESLILNDGVRPDVLLITQNALVDNRYLEMLRHRLSGKCRIPHETDLREAFNTFAQEVKSGRRPDHGGLAIEEDGKVSVTGSLAVMEINGILAKWIFDHNRGSHPFYVEESYAIPWMYDHLSPHGLIMKLNAKTVGRFPARLLRSDQDFWDWQTRRLLDDPLFCRRRAERMRFFSWQEGEEWEEHRVACRAFSKLRCAIAGLYAKKGLVHESKGAFHEALALDPQSPEALGRYLQECLLPQRRLGLAQELLEHRLRVNPNDPSAKAWLDAIRPYREPANRGRDAH